MGNDIDEWAYMTPPPTPVEGKKNIFFSYPKLIFFILLPAFVPDWDWDDEAFGWPNQSITSGNFF